MAVYNKKEMLSRQMLGKSTVSSGSSITVPASVIKNYDLKKGDKLEWYPSTIDFPNEKFPDIIVVIIKRKCSDA